MGSRMRSQVLRTVLAFVTAVLLSCPAGAAAEGPPVHKPETEAGLLSAFAALKNHIQGRNELDAKQIEAHKLTIDRHRGIFGRNDATIKACFDLVAAYDQVKGPLWVARGANSPAPRAIGPSVSMPSGGRASMGRPRHR